MTNAQQQALQHLKNTIERHGYNQFEDKAIAPQLTEWAVAEESFGLWVTAQTERVGLPEGNLLRALDHEFWAAIVGPRGKITLRMGPKSLKQFQGRKFCGIHINYR